MTSKDSPPVKSTTEVAPVEQIDNSTSTPLIRLIDGMSALSRINEMEADDTKQMQM